MCCAVGCVVLGDDAEAEAENVRIHRGGFEDHRCTVVQYDVRPHILFPSLPFKFCSHRFAFLKSNSLHLSFTVLVHSVHPPRILFLEKHVQILEMGLVLYGTKPTQKLITSIHRPDRTESVLRPTRFRGGWPRTPVPAGQSGLICPREVWEDQVTILQAQS